MISIEVVKGKKIAHYAKYIASLRLMMFREFPYLYDGKMEDEEKYLAMYSDLPDGIVVLAKDNDLVVGLLTGMPAETIAQIMTGLKAKLDENHRPLKSAYYFGEYLVLPGYRGLGISSKLSEAMDNEIKKLHYKKAYQITVMREKNHPCQPKHYKDQDKLWESMGWKKTDMTLELEWHTVMPNGETPKQINQVLLWEKELT